MADHDQEGISRFPKFQTWFKQTIIDVYCKAIPNTTQFLCDALEFKEITIPLNSEKFSKKRVISQVIEPEESKVMPTKRQFRRTEATKPVKVSFREESKLNLQIMNSAPMRGRLSKSLQSIESSEDEEFLIPNFSQQPSDPLSLSIIGSQTSISGSRQMNHNKSRALRMQQAPLLAKMPRNKSTIANPKPRVSSTLSNVLHLRRTDANRA